MGYVDEKNKLASVFNKIFGFGFSFVFGPLLGVGVTKFFDKLSLSRPRRLKDYCKLGILYGVLTSALTTFIFSYGREYVKTTYEKPGKEIVQVYEIQKPTKKGIIESVIAWNIAGLDSYRLYKSIHGIETYKTGIGKIEITYPIKESLKSLKIDKSVIENITIQPKEEEICRITITPKNKEKFDYNEPLTPYNSNIEISNLCVKNPEKLGNILKKLYSESNKSLKEKIEEL